MKLFGLSSIAHQLSQVTEEQVASLSDEQLDRVRHEVLRLHSIAMRVKVDRLIADASKVTGNPQIENDIAGWAPPLK